MEAQNDQSSLHGGKRDAGLAETARYASKNMNYVRLPGFKQFNMIRGSMKREDPAFDTDIQTYSAGEFIDPSAGPLRDTYNQYDFALEGDGFFLFKLPAALPTRETAVSEKLLPESWSRQTAPNCSAKQSQ